MRNRLLQLATLLCCSSIPQLVSAQPTLNGATFFNADANGDNRTVPGQFHGSWRTNPGILNQYVSFFLTPNADAVFSAGSFYNNGSAGLSRQLTLGLNTFYFYASGFDPVGAIPNFGLNLWFGTGAQSNCADAPLISALANPANNSVVANGSLGTTTQCLQPNSYIQGSNTLSLLTGGYTVSLQSFQLIQDASKSVGTVDRVSALTLGADQARDNYGVFTLNVSQSASTVPEPSTYLLMASGLAGIGVVARRRRQKR